MSCAASAIAYRQSVLFLRSVRGVQAGLLPRYGVPFRSPFSGPVASAGPFSATKCHDRLPNGAYIGVIRFSATCPKCAKVRPQRGYDANSLLRLLNGGYPVEAYCAACGVYWPISIKERATLAEAAVAGGGKLTP